MGDKEKLDSGKYTVVPKWKNLVQFWSIIIFMLSAIVYFVQKDGLTFDNQQQKQRVIKEHPISQVQSTHVIDHTHDEGIHMSFEEKKDLIILEQTQIKLLENQEKIGGDLQQIKQLIIENR